MDSSSFLSDEFTRLSTEKQDEEIGKLFFILGGIPITRDPNEIDKDFRNRTFIKALQNLPNDSKYKGDFFDNIIIPSLIEDFKDSSVNTQQILMDKLSELADGLSINRNSDETNEDFRIRFYSRLLPALPPDSKYKMVDFAWQINDSDDEESDIESISTLKFIEEQPQNRIPKLKSKSDLSSILCREFSRMPAEKQDEEIKNLFLRLGGISMRKKRNESDNDFRNRTFKKAMEILPDDSEYKTEFFDNSVVPAMINESKLGGGNTRSHSYPTEPLKTAEGEPGFNPEFIATLTGRPPPSPSPAPSSSNPPPPPPKRKHRK